MKLTRFSDYSLRILMYLAVKGDEVSTMTEIAEGYRISRNHVMKVVYELGQMGYLSTTRGKNGGIRLRLDPEKINIGKLIRDTEKNMVIVECFGAENHCRITPACVLKGALTRALSAFLHELDQYTLADLVRPRTELQRLFA